jgi:uncharacterized RDD family membrane protein YckC
MTRRSPGATVAGPETRLRAEGRVLLAGERATPSAWAQADRPRPPAPAGTVYAGVGIRFVALVLDLLPLLVLSVVLFGPILWELVETIVRAMPTRPRPGQTSFPGLEAAMAEAIVGSMAGLFRAGALLQLATLLYFAGTWLAFSRTPAMALLGIRIVREEDGARIDPGRVAVRFAGSLLSAVPLLLGYAWALWDRRKQTWHDKLAGTLVVRDAPVLVAWPAGDASWPIPESGATTDEASPAVAVRRRPSIGALAEAAWRTYRRAPLDLLAALAVVIVPAAIVLFPLAALLLAQQQDQAFVAFGGMSEAFRFSDPDAIDAYNREMLAAAAPSVWTSTAIVAVGGITGALFGAGCAAAVDETGAVRTPSQVTRTLVGRLPTLLALWVIGGLIFAAEVLVFGVPALLAGSIDLANAGARQIVAQAAAFTALGWLVAVPATLYLGALWVLAVVAAVKEELGVAGALRRAWLLSRGQMLWLIGLLIVVGLAATTIGAPLGLLPTGLLSEAYLAGDRLPVVVSLPIVAGLGLAVAPVVSLVYVEAYRALGGESPQPGPEPLPPEPLPPAGGSAAP